MSDAMELTPQALNQIGDYVRRNLPGWLREAEGTTLNERMIRVEEELKTQRELMREGFAQVDKRFELMEKRFEQIDKRFEQVERRFEQIDKRFELVEKRFEQVDKRFDQIDKRFEEVGQRFTDMHSYTNRWMMVISLVLTIMTVMMSVSTLSG
jgi:predicted nuclease with TOPRIM domain